MKYFLLIFSFLFFSCEKDECVDEKVCFKLYLVNGMTVEKSFNLPSDRQDIDIRTKEGSYWLAYKESGVNGHWINIRAGVVDFNILNCKE